MRAASSSPGLLWLVAAVVLPGVAIAAGCSRSGVSAEREPRLAREPRAVVVRVGPLVGEHPLYPEVAELTSYLGAAETADLKAAKAFLASPLGRQLAPPRSVAQRSVGLTAWEEAAEADLSARLEEANELIRSWPRPELSKARRRMSAKAADELRRLRNEKRMEAVAAEMRAIEERKGLLTELRQLAASEDEERAARAVDRQVELWREVAAEAEMTRREGEDWLREREDEHRRELEAATARLSAAADEDRDSHLAGLAEVGRPARQALGPAAEAAQATVEPAANATEAPAAPELKALGELIAETERAHRTAWERRRTRLAAARSRLLEGIAQDTRTAVRAIAAMNGIEVHFACVDEQDLPDATEDFRPLLRDHWAARPAVKRQATVLATR